MKYHYDEKCDVIIAEPNCADECLIFMWMYGCDYDGRTEPDELKSLIKELVQLADDAQKYIDEGKLDRNNPDVIKEEKETNIQAEKDRDEYRTLKRGNDYEILL